MVCGVGLLQAVMAQIRWGRAGLVRLSVIPSPSCVGVQWCGDNTRGSAAVRTFTFAGREGTSGPEETQNKAAALSKEISGGMLLAEVEYRKVGKPMNLRAHQAFIHCLLRDLFG